MKKIFYFVFISILFLISPSYSMPQNNINPSSSTYINFSSYNSQLNTTNSVAYMWTGNNYLYFGFNDGSGACYDYSSYVGNIPYMYYSSNAKRDCFLSTYSLDDWRNFPFRDINASQVISEFYRGLAVSNTVSGSAHNNFYTWVFNNLTGALPVGESSTFYFTFLFDLGRFSTSLRSTMLNNFITGYLNWAGANNIIFNFGLSNQFSGSLSNLESYSRVLEGEFYLNSSHTTSAIGVASFSYTITPDREIKNVLFQSYNNGGNGNTYNLTDLNEYLIGVYAPGVTYVDPFRGLINKIYNFDSNIGMNKVFTDIPLRGKFIIDSVSSGGIEYTIPDINGAFYYMNSFDTTIYEGISPIAYKKQYDDDGNIVYYYIDYDLTSSPGDGNYVGIMFLGGGITTNILLDKDNVLNYACEQQKSSFFKGSCKLIMKIPFLNKIFWNKLSDGINNTILSYQVSMYVPNGSFDSDITFDFSDDKSNFEIMQDGEVVEVSAYGSDLSRDLAVSGYNYVSSTALVFGQDLDFIIDNSYEADSRHYLPFMKYFVISFASIIILLIMKRGAH